MHTDTDTDVCLYPFFAVLRFTCGAPSCSTHSWRCLAEGAGWPQDSSPHHYCLRSYSAGCRSVSPGANNSHWCTGTCTLPSQGTRTNKILSTVSHVLWTELCSVRAKDFSLLWNDTWCSTLQLQRTKTFFVFKVLLLRKDCVLFDPTPSPQLK